MTTMPFAYFQEQITPLEQACISIASNSLQYGTTCFAGIRGYHINNCIRVFRLKDHHQRLMHAAKIMGMDFYIDYSKFKEIIGELIAKNAPKGDFYIRPFIFSQNNQLAPKRPGLTFELAIYFAPLGHYFNPNQGMRLMVSSWRKFSDLSMPTKAKAGGCYINSFLATSEAVRCGYDEALMTDQEGSIVEASVANILISYRHRILAPPLGSAQLEGITMRSVVELLEREGAPIHFEKIDRSMLYTCSELLLLGTAAQVSFAESVDGRPITSNGAIRKEPGPLCQMMRKAFAAIIAKNHPLAAEWITEFAIHEPHRMSFPPQNALIN